MVSKNKASASAYGAVSVSSWSMGHSHLFQLLSQPKSKLWVTDVAELLFIMPNWRRQNTEAQTTRGFS